MTLPNKDIEKTSPSHFNIASSLIHFLLSQKLILLRNQKVGDRLLYYTIHQLIYGSLSESYLLVEFADDPHEVLPKLIRCDYLEIACIWIPRIFGVELWPFPIFIVFESHNWGFLLILIVFYDLSVCFDHSKKINFVRR